MSPYGPFRLSWRAAGLVVIGVIVLQNSKMRRQENSAINRPKWVFADSMPCTELTKAAGWKTDCLCDPYIVFRRAHQRPWENLHAPQRRVLQHNRGKSRRGRIASKTARMTQGDRMLRDFAATRQSRPKMIFARGQGQSLLVAAVQIVRHPY
jgi:hypothetical protein